jgi:TrmH family RNA methyltransferase
MGTIIRTADWFGIPTILCSDGCVDAYNPKVVQASMASIGRVAVLETDIREYLRSHQNIPVYGAVLDGKSYTEQDFQNKGILLIGNEGHGIHPDTAKYIQFPITIPRKGKAESLNAAIAAALICAKACL